MIVAPLLHCLFLGSLCLRLWLGNGVVDGSIWTLFYLALLLLGYGSALAMTLLGLLRQGATHLMAAQAWLPAYWLLVGAATVNAAHDLVQRPFYWFKSPHDPAAQVCAWPRVGGFAQLARRLRRS